MRQNFQHEILTNFKVELSPLFPVPFRQISCSCKNSVRQVRTIIYRLIGVFNFPFQNLCDNCCAPLFGRSKPSPESVYWIEMKF